MTGMFSNTVAAGFATHFHFNVTPLNDSKPRELYQLVTVLSESVFIFIFCCVINLLFHQIEIFYLETQILILKLPKETPLDFFGLSTLSTVPPNHQIGQVISALLAKPHPSGCKGSRCGPDRIGDQGPEYRVSEHCKIKDRHFPECAFVYLATDESNVMRLILVLCCVASCKPQACWENARQFVAWRTIHIYIYIYI